MTGTHLSELFYGRESLNSKLFMLISHASLPFLDAVMPAVAGSIVCRYADKTILIVGLHADGSVLKWPQFN